jgi:nucleoside-diphosphate-sugar epimerase
VNVLVTGGHGFVGSHLCERLRARGDRVRILVRAGGDLTHVAGLGLEVVQGDVTDPASLAGAATGIDVVFHLAAALFGPSEAHLLRVNADGTRNLAEACRRDAPGLARFVLVSSLAAAGPSPGGGVPRTEEMPEEPLTWYGTSKLQGERILGGYPDLRPVIVRPPVVFGPRERDVLQFFRMARRGFLPVFGFSDRHYSLVFVDDLVEALLAAAAAAPAPGQVYFAAAPEVVTWRELGLAIAAALGVRARPVPIPEAAGALAGHAADLVARITGRSGIFSSQKVIEMRQRAWVCSAARAARDLGWTAKTPLDRALSETARWYAGHGWV